MLSQISPARRETTGHAPILTSVEARQGLISGRVAVVLVVSLMLVVVAFAVIYTVGI